MTSSAPARRGLCASGTSLGAAQGGGHPGSAVMGRRPAARGLPWVRVVSVWDVMVSVWRPLGGRSKRLVSVYVPPCESETFFTQILLADGSLDGHPKDRLPLRFCMFPAVCFHDRNAESLGADHRLYPASSTSGGADRGVNVAVDPRWRSISSAAGAALPRGLRETVTGIFVKESSRQA